MVSEHYYPDGYTIGYSKVIIQMHLMHFIYANLI